MVLQFSFLPVARFLSVARCASGMSQCLPGYHRWCGMQWTETDEKKKNTCWWCEVECWRLDWTEFALSGIVIVARGSSHLVNNCTLCNSVLKMLFNGDVSQQLSWHGLLKLKCSWSAFISVHFHLKKRKSDSNPTSLYKAFLWSALGLASGFCGAAAAASVSADVSTLWKCKHFISLIKNPPLTFISLTSWGCEEMEVKRRKRRAHHAKRWQQPLLQASAPFPPGWDVKMGNAFFSFFSNLLKSPFHHVRHKRSMLGVLGLVITSFFPVYPSPWASDTVNKCCIWWTGCETI